MFGAGVHPQFLDHGFAQFRFGQHPLNGKADEPFGFFIIILLVFMNPLGIWSEIIQPLILNIMMLILGVYPFFF